MENRELEKQELKKDETLSASQRFTDAILKELKGNLSGQLEISDYQKNLIQGYFIVIDRALKNAEEDRKARNAKNNDHKYDNDLPVTWQNVNMIDLALDLKHYSKLGLDMMQENMLFPIPFKNNKKKLYDINLMEGYNGIRYIAEKYAVEAPSTVHAEVVYSTDFFRPIKKGISNKIEGYEFEIKKPFERGEIVGAFAYIEYRDPSKNKLVTLSLSEIMKRKPEKASEAFWGKWTDEMVWKTMLREAYSAKHIPRDPRKVEEEVLAWERRRKFLTAQAEAEDEIAKNANTIIIDPSDAEEQNLESRDQIPSTSVEPTAAAAETPDF